jgi:hypothetical protein
MSFKNIWTLTLALFLLRFWKKLFDFLIGIKSYGKFRNTLILLMVQKYMKILS